MKYITAVTETLCHILYINKNIICSSALHRGDDRAVVFYIELRFYPLLGCPLISVICLFLLLSVTFRLPSSAHAWMV